jgi:hypothetical protein
MTFYTYLWLREDGTPYYVGKGEGRRAFVSYEHVVPRPKDSARIVLQEHPSEDAAFFAEKFLIAYYGRKDLSLGCLRNRTDGGEGPAGHVCSEKTKAKIRATLTGRKFTPEHVARIANFHRGRKRSEETRRRIGDTSKGRKHMIGFEHTPETIEKLRAIGKQRARNPKEFARLRSISKSGGIAGNLVRWGER